MRTDYPNLPLFALSVRQPWAWAIFNGKDIENRSYISVNTGRMEEGPVCIHAAQGMTHDEYEQAAAYIEQRGLKCPPPAELVRGVIIGTVNVVSIVTESNSPWFEGQCGLVLADQKRLPEPIPCSGALGYFLWRHRLTPGRQVEPLPWMRHWMPVAPAAKQEGLF